MKSKSISSTIEFISTMILIALGLSSCVKAEINLNIHQNGSVLMSVALGLNVQAKSLLNSGATESIAPISDLLGGQTTIAGIKTTRWVDGDYEWVKYEKTLSALNEVNQFFSESTLFNRFSITQNRGLLKNEYLLDAELAPLSTDTQATNLASHGLDMTSIISFRFSVRMPGKLIETNGIPDKKDPNLIYWTLDSSKPVKIQARSQAANTSALLLAIFGIIIVGATVAFILIIRKQKKTQIPTTPTDITNVSKSR